MTRWEANPLQPFVLARALFHLLSLSLLSPVWNETKRLQGKLQQSKLVRLSSSWRRLTVWLTDSLLLAEAKKHSIDRPIRTESTESVTDWTNRMGARGFLPILNTEAWWEKTEISPNSHTMSLTNSCLRVLWHFFQTEHKKVIDIYNKDINWSFELFSNIKTTSYVSSCPSCTAVRTTDRCVPWARMFHCMTRMEGLCLWWQGAMLLG